MNAAERSESIAYNRPPDLPGLETLWVQHCARRWRVFHDTYTVSIGLVLRGPEFEWRYRGSVYHSDAGKLMLMEPGEVHANTKPTPSADFCVALIDPALVERAASDLGLPESRPHLKCGYADDPLLFTAFARLHASLQGEASALERQSRLACCIRLLLERYGERAPALTRNDAERLCRTRQLIEERFMENLTLDDLARASGLSRFYLVRAFVARFGLPPHTLQLRLRLERSRILLGCGFHPAHVAAELGFADQSHFARLFVRTYGVTPGTYRQQVSPRGTSDRGRSTQGRP